MTRVLCQFETPTDPVQLEEYRRWFAGDGLKEVLSTENLEELRVFRNYSGGSPLVTAMLFFPDTRSALQVAESDMWRNVISNLTKWGCQDVIITLLVPSDIIPEPMRP